MGKVTKALADQEEGETKRGAVQPSLLLPVALFGAVRLPEGS